MTKEEAVEHLKFEIDNKMIRRTIFTNQAIKVVLKELDKRDKVIDEMAKFLSDHQIYIPKDTYKELMSTFNKKIERKSYTLEDVHVNCIKQHFYKKVGKNEGIQS